MSEQRVYFSNPITTEIQDPDFNEFWRPPDEAGKMIRAVVAGDVLYVECEHGLYEILEDSTSVGITFPLGK